MAERQLWGCLISSNCARPDGSPTVERGGLVQGQSALRLLSGLQRLQRLVPSERIVAVLPASAEEQRALLLKELSPENVLSEPLPRGTGVSMLRAAAHVLLRAPGATLLGMPAEAISCDDSLLGSAIERAAQLADGEENEVALLGLPAARNDSPSLSWIIPSLREDEGNPRVISILRPDARLPEQILADVGALRGGPLFVARTSAILRLFDRTLPNLLRAWLRGFPRCARPSALRELYSVLPTVDFGADVLGHADDLLMLVPVSPRGFVLDVSFDSFEVGAPPRGWVGEPARAGMASRVDAPIENRVHRGHS